MITPMITRWVVSCNCNKWIVDGKGRCVILRKKILWILAAVSVATVALAGCGKRACGDEPAKNENATDAAAAIHQYLKTALISCFKSFLNI